MTFDFLPPQAYTKETLLKAYNWLQSQSDQVKELATTPDQLVSLFLKSTRLGQESLQRYTNSTTSTFSNTSAPVMTTPTEQSDRPSLQSFKSELKNLAGMMGDLEKPAVVPSKNSANSSPTSSQTSYQNTQPAPNQGTYQSAAPSGYQAPLPPYQGPVTTTQPSAPINAYVSSAPNYDEMTQILIREVKNELNLSSDTEALRMLVKIGYQKVRSLYK